MSRKDVTLIIILTVTVLAGAFVMVRGVRTHDQNIACEAQCKPRAYRLVRPPESPESRICECL